MYVRPLVSKAQYIGDLDGRPALRVDLLIEIALVFRLAHCHCKSIFGEEFPVLGEVRELLGFVAVFSAGCNNILLAGKIGYRSRQIRSWWSVRVDNQKRSWECYSD